MRPLPFTLALLPGLSFVGTLDVMHVEGQRVLVALDARERGERRARERKVMLLTPRQVEEWTGVDLTKHADKGGRR